MNESELYKELGIITRDRDKWEDSISYVSSLLTYESVKIQAKALWLLGEIGLAYPLPSVRVRYHFYESVRLTLSAGSDGATIT